MRRSGAVAGRVWGAINAAILLVFSFVLSSCASAVIAAPQATQTPVRPDEGAITVYVRDGTTGQSVNDVVVRVTNSSLADGIDNRQLRLPACDGGQFLVVAAPNYETSFTPCNGANSYVISLTRLSAVDNTDYVWSSVNSCGSCHQGQYGEGYNEVNEWANTAHSKLFVDPYFMSMYRGTNVNVQSAASAEYGPGFKLDNPGDAGNCAYCHAPSLAPSSDGATDLSSFYYSPSVSNQEGVTCDICHKVTGVDTSTLSADERGVRALQFLRSKDLFVLGSFSNIVLPAYDEGPRHVTSSCSPVLGTSEFCAACHYARFDDIMIYNSYGEWRESRYGKNVKKPTYKTCQDCHMSHMDVKDVSTPLSDRSACSETTANYQNFDHNLMDVGPDHDNKIVPRMIQNAASLDVKLKYDAGSDSLKVRVAVENQKAGHKFPTDTPLRHLILVVNVVDQFGYFLTPLDGPRLPVWAGTSNAEMSANGVIGYADQAGIAYANLLVDERTDTWPAMSYWNKTRYLFEGEDGKNSDTRLAPRDPQVSEYTFPVPDLGEMHITVKLIYRYAFFDLMDQKDWVRPDVNVAVADCPMLVSQEPEKDCPEVAP